MKILLVHNKYKQRGGEDVAVELESSLLLSKGHSVEVLYFDNAEISSGNNGFMSAARAIYNSDSANLLSKRIEEFQPDILHIHNLFFIASPSILYAAWKKKIPVVQTLHNYRLICANSLLLRDNRPCELCRHQTFPMSGIIYKCYRGSSGASALVTTITSWHKVIGTWQKKIDKFIALTNFARNKLEDSSLKPLPNQIVVKPNFIPDPGTNHSEREDFFLFVGRLSAEKGAKFLCEAFSQLQSNLIIAGDGPEKVELEKQYADCSNISFTGLLERNAVLDLMKKCKALIIPSIWYEGLPFTMLEAFSMGTPVLASRLGGMEESIEPGKNGFLFNPNDAPDITRCIMHFLGTIKSDPGIYHTTREIYLARYHPESNYNAIMNIYEEVIRKKKNLGPFNEN
jgi:glycosyltransferase involved in cell wall biosynthesis